MSRVSVPHYYHFFETDLAREGRQRRQLLLTFLSMVTRWSRSTSNFYAPGAPVCSDWSKFDR